jgi:hypothetical protein
MSVPAGRHECRPKKLAAAKSVICATCLADALRGGQGTRAYLVLGGDGWTLRQAFRSPNPLRSRQGRNARGFCPHRQRRSAPIPRSFIHRQRPRQTLANRQRFMSSAASDRASLNCMYPVVALAPAYAAGDLADFRVTGSLVCEGAAISADQKRR